MRLWTHQSKGFAIESTAVDHTKSDYYNNIENLPNVQVAYHRLFRDLKTDKFLWCCPSERFPPSREKVLYELEVPEEEILAYICECVWHKIITDCREYPRFNNQDCQTLWQGQKNGKEYEEQQTKKCHSKESEDQLWERLFWPQPTIIPCPANITLQPQQKNEMFSALIKSPIEKEWIRNITYPTPSPPHTNTP